MKRQRASFVYAEVGLPHNGAPTHLLSGVSTTQEQAEHEPPGKGKKGKAEPEKKEKAKPAKKAKKETPPPAAAYPRCPGGHELKFDVIGPSYYLASHRPGSAQGSGQPSEQPCGQPDPLNHNLN